LLHARLQLEVLNNVQKYVQRLSDNVELMQVARALGDAAAQCTVDERLLALFDRVRFVCVVALRRRCVS
jgi:hypothetical protein